MAGKYDPEMTRRDFLKGVAVAGVAAAAGPYISGFIGSNAHASGDPTEISERFFDDEKNTRLDFGRISKKYAGTGLDEVIRSICPAIPKEYNDGIGAYSFPGKLAGRFGNDYATVEKRHKKEGLTWYNIDDSGITRKLPKVESGFIDII